MTWKIYAQKGDEGDSPIILAANIFIVNVVYPLAPLN